MKVRGNVVVVCHEGRRLSAAWGSVQKDRVRVKGWHTAEQPPDLDAGDSVALGAWVGGVLKEAGCGARACVVAVPRASVVLKRLTLPVSPDVRERELAGMVQLQMARQLTMPLTGAAIDYVRLGGLGEADPERESAARSEVLAAALPGEYVSSAQGMAKAARLRLRSVALRGEGSATLFAQLSYTQDGPVLGVSVTPQGVELGIVVEGRVVFSRAVEIAAPSGVDGWSGFAQRVAVEAKRTRVAYRGTGDTADLACVGLLGDDALADAVGKTLGEELGLPWHTVRFPNTVELPSEMDSATRAALAPLIGLMVGSAIQRPTYDFSNPRRAPDAAAAVRQVALAGVFGLIVCVGGTWVVADQQRGALEADIKDAQDEVSRLTMQYVRQRRAEARIEHLELLRGDDTDWLAHLQYLSRALPPAERMRLDSLSGSGVSSVRFVGAEGEDVNSLEDGRWRKGRRVSFTLAGNASREVADGLRAELVSDNVYELTTRGADIEGKFEYVLESLAASPWSLARRDGEGEAIGEPEARDDAGSSDGGADDEGGAS